MMARIIRKYQDDSVPDRIIAEDVTVAEAKAHCSLPDSRGDGWMDVWYRDKGEE